MLRKPFAQRSHFKAMFSLQRRTFAYTTLYANTNQARGLADYAIEFLQ
jgi:hypothetical protein